MIKLFDIFPGWLWAAIVAGLIALFAITSARLSSERLDHESFKAYHAEQVATAEKARADEESKRRKIEQELLNAQSIHASEINSRNNQLAAARAASRVVSDRLRSATATAAERARGQCAATSATGLRETADDPIGMLAYVLGRIDERAGELADIADQRGIAGSACEREYDNARKALAK